jgi:hypothetical protein
MSPAEYKIIDGKKFVWDKQNNKYIPAPDTGDKVIEPNRKPSGIGISRLANGAIYQGKGRYGLPSASQKRVYDKAMDLWKSRADDTTLVTILSRIVEPYAFDADVYPDLKALVDMYVRNGNKL